MLSRIADSLFWIGRYIERADGTARMVDVLRLSLVEDPGQDESYTSSMLLGGIMGYDDVAHDVAYSDVAARLVFDASNPSAVSGSWLAARENARRARETLSTELWEVINTSWRRWNGLGASTATQQHLSWVTERAALVAGIADSTMSHDEAWEFLSLGRSLERADMTARIVATGALQGGPSWGVVLASCGAQQAMLRTMRGMITDRTAAAFLTLDRRFPRSVLAALRDAEDRLTVLAPDIDRVGFSDEARRILGQTRTQLEYANPDDVLEDLPTMMGMVQRSVTRASDEIGARYFRSGPVQEWTGEIL
ncbi:alpha-E domain-containing protein [Janibacter melonis]|uniref:Alpha-E domain-containing protein n=1 Tax=Janibacter melonis TaxID=262209 RepID=A0A650GEB2_9MICO|nr:alpha-E domain-containing protein [Janibacter melonis]MCB5993033.1 alpha-E domain-containing protein [Janibacter melonis]QGX08281.1 alpha-E domain-containing protein [Janibacter melonis]